MTIGRRISHYMTIAVMLVSSTSAMAQSAVFGQSLEGAWNAALVFNETGLPPCAPAPFVSMATAPGRGIVIADSCYASEGAGYGTWVRTGNNPDGTIEGHFQATGVRPRFLAHLLNQGVKIPGTHFDPSHPL